jgi:hypothetical protein
MVIRKKAGAIKMKLEHCKIFADLCENITEVSSTMNLIAGNAGGQQVVRTLHSDMSLAHNIEYKPIDKITWKDLKDSYQGTWVIIVGSQGTAAIKATSNGYDTVASDGGDAEKMSNSRSDATMNFIKSKVGKIQKYYAGRNTSYVRDKQKARTANKDVAGPSNVTQTTIVNKFRPLWAKAITAAIADAKGHVSNMIKNDAFQKAKSKISYIENLQDGLDALESGSNDVPSFVSNAVNTAVLMTASHYYPEETGEITKGYSRGYTSERSQGPARVLSDLSGGDTAKLGTILAFFKRALISG